MEQLVVQYFDIKPVFSHLWQRTLGYEPPPKLLQSIPYQAVPDNIRQQEGNELLDSVKEWKK